MLDALTAGSFGQSRAACEASSPEASHSPQAWLRSALSRCRLAAASGLAFPASTCSY